MSDGLLGLIIASVSDVEYGCKLQAEAGRGQGDSVWHGGTGHLYLTEGSCQRLSKVATSLYPVSRTSEKHNCFSALRMHSIKQLSNVLGLSITTNGYRAFMSGYE